MEDGKCVSIQAPETLAEQFQFSIQWTSAFCVILWLFLFVQLIANGNQEHDEKHESGLDFLLLVACWLLLHNFKWIQLTYFSKCIDFHFTILLIYSKSLIKFYLNVSTFDSLKILPFSILSLISCKWEQ